MEKPPELVVQEEWSNEAVFYACKWIDEASAVYFRPSQTIDDEEVMFGELIIRKTNGETFEISRKLCEQGFATSSEKFLDMFNRSKSSIIERWNNNVRNGAIFEYPDSLVIGGDIGDTAEVEAAKARKIREILPKVERVKMENREAIDEINKSIDKVRLWQSNNAGVKPEDEPVNLELPLQPIPENYEYDIEAYQVLEEEKSTKEVTRKSGSSKTRSFIVVPSGAPINISVRSPRYVDENFQAVTMRPANTSQQPVESPQELYELNASPEESNDGPSDNPMEPFISKPKKADCCINQ